MEGFYPLELARVISNEGQEEQRYLDVKYRKLWFRLVNPTGKIISRIVHFTENMAVVEARIYLDKCDQEQNYIANSFSQKFRTADIQDEEHGVGCGYVCECDGMNVRELAQRAKDVLGCRVVRFSGGEREIRRVGVCSGSGGSFLVDAVGKGCQVLLTGDVKHDIFIDGENMGISVIDAGHFYTENIFCEFIAGELKNKFSDLRVEIAVSNRDIVEVI